MAYVPRHASLDKVLKASNLSPIEFHAFRKITRAVADDYEEKYPNTQFKDYPVRTQRQIVINVNERLHKLRIHTVGEDIISWKMHTLIRDIIKAKRGRVVLVRREANDDKPTISEEVPQQTTRLFFDPIRDVWCI